MQDPRVTGGLGVLKDQETGKEEEAGPGHPWLRGSRKEFAFYPKGNQNTLMRLQKDLVQFLLLFKSGLLGYNLHSLYSLGHAVLSFDKCI